MTFSEILRQLMKNGNITPYRLSKDLNVHQTTIKNWLDGQTPGPENIQKIATRFDVSIDFMLGLEELMTCKECGLLYDPLDQGDSADHQQFHTKKIHAIEKFGKLFDYKERQLIKRKAERFLQISSVAADLRAISCIRYFRALFSESIEFNHFSLDHPSFDRYVSMLLFQKYWEHFLGDDLYPLLLSKYGKQPGLAEGELHFAVNDKHKAHSENKLKSISILEQSAITPELDSQIESFISYLLSQNS